MKCYVNPTLNEIIRSKASPLAQMDKVKKTCLLFTFLLWHWNCNHDLYHCTKEKDVFPTEGNNKNLFTFR